MKLKPIQQLWEEVGNLKDEYSKLITDNAKNPQEQKLLEFLNKATVTLSELNLQRPKAKETYENLKLNRELEFDRQYIAYREDKKTCNDAEKLSFLGTEELRKKEIEALKVSRYGDDIQDAIKEMINSTKKNMSNNRFEEQNIKYNQQ